MQYEDMIRLRKEAQRFSGQEAQEQCDKIFAYLLYIAVTKHSSGLRIVISTEDPGGYDPSKRSQDHVYVVDAASGKRAGTRMSRLNFKWATSACLAGKTEKANRRSGGPPPRVTPSAAEMFRLKMGTDTALRGAPKKMDVFEPAQRHNGQREPAYA